MTREDMILGMDFLRPLGTNFDLTNGKLKIGKTKIKLKSTKVAGAMDVVTVRRVNIPAHSVNLVDCKMPDLKGDMVVEQKGDLPTSVIMARSFHSPGSTAKVCVLNMSNSPVTLKAGK